MAPDPESREHLVLARGQWRRDATPGEIQAAIGSAPDAALRKMTGGGSPRPADRA